MNKSQLKQLIKECINELVGDEPQIGMYKYSYEVTYTYPSDGRVTKSTNTPQGFILAKDDNEAKMKAIEPFNKAGKPSAVVKRIGPVTQQDIENYNRMRNSIGSIMQKDPGWAK
jgi:hypothetical protein